MPDVLDRILKRVFVSERGCWEFQGCRINSGYGRTSWDGRLWLTHRVTYTLLVGEILDGLEIDHLCKNKSCCNPAHLDAVTLVTATVPTGKKQGTHIGRVAVRSTGSFNITTPAGTVQGIHHRHCRILQRSDGWNYHQQEEEVPVMSHNSTGGAIPPRPKGRGLHAPDSR